MSVYTIEAIVGENEHNHEFSTYEQASGYGKLLERHPHLVSYVLREAPQTSGADYKHHKQWPAQERAVVLAPEDHMAALQAEIDAHSSSDKAGGGDHHDLTAAL